jgi:hypothetical protein
MARPGLEPVRTASPVTGRDAVTVAMARPGLEPVRTASPVTGRDAVTVAMARPGLEPVRTASPVTGCRHRGDGETRARTGDTTIRKLPIPPWRGGAIRMVAP